MIAAIAVVESIYALWIFYLAVMNLRRAKESGRLSKAALVCALPVLIAGFAIDVAFNLVVATVLFLDVPRELTTSTRLARYLPQDNWRGRLAIWIAANLLDPFDPSGTHIAIKR